MKKNILFAIAMMALTATQSVSAADFRMQADDNAIAQADDNKDAKSDAKCCGKDAKGGPNAKEGKGCPGEGKGKEGVPAGKVRQRLTREQLAEKQANYISQQLGLNDATTKKFVDLYAKNQKEIWDAMPQRREGEKCPEGGEAKKRTDAESEKQIKNEFAMSEKLLQIRQKYYKEYSKVLSQQQIQRVYELEREMHERFVQRGPRGGQRQGGQRQGGQRMNANGQDQAR